MILDVNMEKNTRLEEIYVVRRVRRNGKARDIFHILGKGEDALYHETINFPFKTLSGHPIYASSTSIKYYMPKKGFLEKFFHIVTRKSMYLNAKVDDFFFDVEKFKKENVAEIKEDVSGMTTSYLNAEDLEKKLGRHVTEIISDQDKPSLVADDRISLKMKALLLGANGIANYLEEDLASQAYSGIPVIIGKRIK